MIDPVRALRWGCLLAAACTHDPTLDISVHHPSGYAVKQTLVTVYFGGDVDCSKIEFGDLTDLELAAIAVDEVDVASGTPVEVSRLGGKSIVARGYDAQHRLVTAGCHDLGEVAGSTRVAIDTQPTAVIAIDPGQPERPFSEREILINMTDTNGVPLDGTVSWLLTGPYGAPQQMQSAGTPTRNGNIRVKVDDIGTPGPQGLRIRAPWAAAQLPLVTAFDLSHAMTFSLTSGGLGGNPACDVRGHAGKPPTLVCLTSADARSHRDAIEFAWHVDRYQPAPIAIPGTLDNQFALFVDHDGSADEPVYVLSAVAGGVGNWYRLGDTSGTDTSKMFGNTLQNVVYIPRCHDSATALVGVQTGVVASSANKVSFYTPSGATAPSPLNMAIDGGVLSGGCVHDVDRKEHQGVVTLGPTVVGGTDATVGTLQLITAGGLVAIPGRLAGSGFVTVSTQSMTEKRFAGTRIQATGSVVFEAVLAPDAGSFKLVERTEVESAAPPDKIISGKLDRDGDTDLMWAMAVGARRRLFQVSLAEQVGGAPLTAITSGPSAVATATAGALDFAAADLDGRGTDEMIVFSASAVTIYSPDE